MARLLTIGEIRLIRRIERRFRRLGPKPLAGIGEDAAILRTSPGDLALSTDLCLEGVHFRRRWAPPAAIGWKALAANLSDMAAVGALPSGWLLALGLPRNLPERFFLGLLEGMARLARRHNLRLLGGDTCACARIAVGITILGRPPRGGFLPRSGARPGDQLLVSGPLGGSALGLRLLRSGWRWRGEGGTPPAGRGIRTGPDRLAAGRRALRAHLFPEPPVRAGRILAVRRLASAAIDLSDGLGIDLSRLCEASGVGALLEAGSLPVAACLHPFLEREAAARLSIEGGEDYELLIAAPPGRAATLVRLGAGGRRFHRIGEVRSRGFGLRIRNREGRLLPLPVKGFEHFRS